MTTFESLPLWKAAYCTLYRADSLHISLLMEQMESLGWQSSGKTPLQTLRSELRRYSKSSDAKKVYFENLGQATWRLTLWGKGNPPAGVNTLLFSNDVSWIESESEFLDNQRLFLQAQQSDTISMATLQKHRSFYYDAHRHQFFPLQWLLRRDWILQRQWLRICPNQSALLAQWGIEASTDPILSTRFAQWCRECGCQDLFSIDVHADIALYKDGGISG